MEDPNNTTGPAARITGVAFVACYVSNFQAAYEFYADLLGLEKLYDMGPGACYFKISEGVGLYLEGNRTPTEVTPASTRSSFGLSVPSAAALHATLVAAGVRCVHAAPVDMGSGMFWFQFHDPSGNIIEALGGQ